MRKINRFAAPVLAAALALALTITASAAVDDTGFSDVSVDAWYAEAVMYCKEHNLMDGIGNGLFSPERNLTRAQLAAVLYRMEGAPAVTGTDSFLDTADGAWYSDAVLWASQQRLVSGYGGGIFGPDDPVSREQMTAILWRYAGSPTVDGANNFADEDAISDYALAAVKWAVADNIVAPVSGSVFAPTSDATRAHVAAALMNYSRSQQSGTAPNPVPSEEMTVGSDAPVLNLTINGITLTAVLENNSSARALLELLANGPITIDMRDYGNMEKVGSLGTSLPTNNEQINTQAGDIILYQGNQITIYYDTNSWSLTRLGRISHITAQELRELLGSGDVSVTLSLG